MRNTEQYGQYYWCVSLSDEKATEVYLHADEITVTDGTVEFWRKKEGGERLQMLSFAPNTWKFFYAASVIDGHAVAVDHWPGQIVE